MRILFALLALFGLLACHSLTATAADTSEPVNPFAQPAAGSRGVSARVSDEPDAQQRRGFSLSKLSLPKLPKPSLPKPSMPKFELPKLKMPKISMPKWTKKEASRNAGPSPWEKLNSGTKRMFAKTRSTLMPWATNGKPPVRRATGSRTRVASNRGSRAASSGEKRSIFSSFLPSAEPEAKPILTTSDFLSQPRPYFN